MRPTASYFNFSFYHLKPSRKEVDFGYKIVLTDNKELDFIETIRLPRPIPLVVNQELLNKILNDLHLMLGVSYWKLYCPKNIKISTQPLSKKQAEFWNIVYTKGLGEFFYRNQIDFRGLVNFPYKDDVVVNPIKFGCRDRSLIGIGGGKDSLVSIELLKEKNFPIVGLALKPGSAMILDDEYKKKLGIEIITLERKLSSQLVILKDVYKGHVPVSAIYAFLGLLTAVIYDCRYFIISNERSANFGNLEYLGKQINHQWSKSLEFEQIFQDYTKKYITPDVTYFSLLRSLSEIKIVQLFTRYKKYFPYFTSCNRNFSTSNPLLGENKWCGECAKCAFMFALLSAFLSKKELIDIFGQNLFVEQRLLPVYRDLLGFGMMKPFDCVGTFEETQVAFYLTYQKKEFSSDVVMKMFEKEILPKIEDINKVQKEVFKAEYINNMPDKFKLVIPL